MAPGTYTIYLKAAEGTPFSNAGSLNISIDRIYYTPGSNNTVNIGGDYRNLSMLHLVGGNNTIFNLPMICILEP